MQCSPATLTLTQLCFMLRPAFPAFMACKTKKEIKDNAQQWFSVTLRTLEQHYSTLLSDLLFDVALILPESWSSPFLVATRWASKNFPKLHQSTIDRAKQLIKTHTQEQRALPTPNPALPLHPPATMGPPSLPAAPTPQLPDDSPPPEPTPRLPHRPPSSTPPVGNTRKHRSPPKASTSAPLKPQPPQRQDLRLRDDSTPGDHELPCSPSLRPPKSQKVNAFPPLKPSGTGRLTPADVQKAKATNTHGHEEETEESHTIKILSADSELKKKSHTNIDKITHITYEKPEKCRTQ